MKKVILATLALAPVLASAAELSNIQTLVEAIGELVATALPIVVALALLAFFWGLVKFIFAQGNEESKADAKKIMLWGLIALFVMVAVWGLVKFIGDALGINQGDTITVPTVPGI
ncbi:MAG: hypothetical protein Q8Q22_00475 [bacterium]|nr:hypothetical protein [bacterium]